LADLIDTDKFIETKYFGLNVPISWCSLAVTLDPQNFYAWYNLGFFQYKDDDFPSSENSMEQCIRHNPSWIPAYGILSRILSSRGLLKTALIIIDKAISKDKDYPDLHNDKGTVLLDYGKYEEALKSFESTITLISKISDQTEYERGFEFYAFMGKIRALLELGDFHGIIDTYLIMTAKNPNDITSLNNLGFFYEKIGEKEKALECWRRCIEIGPPNWSSILSIGINLLKEGKKDDGLKLVQEAANICPSEKIRSVILQKKIDELEQVHERSFAELVNTLGGFQLKGDKMSDEKRFVRHLASCKDYIFWLDPYFSKGGLAWLEEACLSPTEIQQVRILTILKKEGSNEILSRKFWRSFDQTRKKLESFGIAFTLKVVLKTEHIKKIHGSFLFSKNGSWAIPRVMNIKIGSKDEITPSSKLASDFDEEWNGSLDYVTDYEKIEKYRKADSDQL